MNVGFSIGIDYVNEKLKYFAFDSVDFQSYATIHLLSVF